jgi:hypothetical protein
MKKILFPIIAIVLAMGLTIPMATPAMADPDTVTVNSDTTVQIVGVYNEAEGVSTFVDLSGSPLNAVRAQEPKPYPTGYVSEGPEITDSVWDNGINWFEDNSSSADWIWETERAEGPATVYGVADPLYDADAARWGRVVVFQKTFTINGTPTEGSVINIAADNCYEVWINGQFLARSATAKVAGWETSALHEDSVATTGWQTVGHHAIPDDMLQNGINTLVVLAGNEYFWGDDSPNFDNPTQSNPYAQYNPGAAIFQLDVEYEPRPQEINVPIDIKPTSCPNPLDVCGKCCGKWGTKCCSKDVVSVAILGTDEFDITQIDPGTVALVGVAPLRWSLEDVATPFEGELENCLSCTKEGPDGYIDLVFKFDKQELVTAIGEVEDGECLELSLAGILLDGSTAFSGSDFVTIIDKCKCEKPKPTCKYKKPRIIPRKIFWNRHKYQTQCMHPAFKFFKGKNKNK